MPLGHARINRTLAWGRKGGGNSRWSELQTGRPCPRTPVSHLPCILPASSLVPHLHLPAHHRSRRCVDSSDTWLAHSSSIARDVVLDGITASSIRVVHACCGCVPFDMERPCRARERHRRRRACVGLSDELRTRQTRLESPLCSCRAVSASTPSPPNATVSHHGGIHTRLRCPGPCRRKLCSAGKRLLAKGGLDPVLPVGFWPPFRIERSIEKPESPRRNVPKGDIMLDLPRAARVASRLLSCERWILALIVSRAAEGCGAVFFGPHRLPRAQSTQLLCR